MVETVERPYALTRRTSAVQKIMIRFEAFMRLAACFVCQTGVAGGQTQSILLVVIH